MTNRPAASRIGHILFRLRSLTPIPFILVLIFFSRPVPFPIALGCLLIALGEWLRVWAVGYAGGSTRTRSLGAARDLVTTGPYAYVRNPLYLGNLLLSLGVCIFADVYWMIAILVVGFLIQYIPIIRSEETYLLETCGDRYRAYCASVPSLDSASWSVYRPIKSRLFVAACDKKRKTNPYRDRLRPHLDCRPVPSATLESSTLPTCHFLLTFPQNLV